MNHSVCVFDFKCFCHSYCLVHEKISDEISKV